MDTESMQAVWERQYAPGVDSALKDKNLFRLEVNAVVHEIQRNAYSLNDLRILEIGCGTGALLETLSKHFMDGNRKAALHGVDFARTAIASANSRGLPNCEFYCADVLEFLENRVNQYDVVVSQRAIMAVMDRNDQKTLLLRIKRSLSERGFALLSECFANKFEEFNAARALMGLAPIEKVWHSLHLEESDLHDTFSTVSFNDFCSTYMLITRVIYPYFEEPKHNQAIHNLACALPQSGSMGFLRLAIAHP